jgi:hypothetical protein
MGGAATSRLEVGDGPDGRAPPASDRPQKGEGVRCWADGREENGLARAAARGEGGRRPGSLRGLKEKERRKGLGRLKEKGERRGSEGFSLF